MARTYSSVEFLKPFVHPHLDSEPLADERHLVGAVLGRQELLPLPLLRLVLSSEVDVLVGRGRGVAAAAVAGAVAQPAVTVT